MDSDDRLSETDIGLLYTELFGDSPLRLMISRADDGVIVNVSETLLLETFGGLDRASILGKTGVEVGIWTDDSARLELVEILREQGTRFRRYDYTDHLGKDRTQLRFSKLLVQNGTEYLAGIAMEVSELRETEQRLRAAAERLEKAQEIAGIGDYIYEPTSGQLTGSAMLFRILRQPVSIDPIPLETVLEGLEPKDAQHIRDSMNQPIDGFEIELRLTREGQERWIKITGDATPSMQPVKGVIQDVTEQRLREAQRQQALLQIQEAQKLESLGLLAGGVAHDFNNLLSGILGNADLARLDVANTNMVRERLDDIIRASQNAADLTRQLLAYSGKGRFIIQAVDLSEVVQEMTQLLEVSATGRANIQYNLKSDLPGVNGDETQIKQVIMNLIMNAVEAVDAKTGRVTITTGTQFCDQGYLDQHWAKFDITPGEFVFVEVSDNGTGMTSETKARLFEPFYTTKFTGRGLGMSAVHGIVNGHGGAVILYSEPGKGTSLKILLPVSEQPFIVRPHLASPEHQDGHHQLVLVIDDDEEVRSTIKRVLEHYGYDVTTAQDGETGLSLFSEHVDNTRLVLIDLTMPGIGGVEVFRRLRHIKRSVPAILMSGYNEQDATQQFVGKGLAGFLHKPFLIDDLMGKIEEVLGIA